MCTYVYVCNARTVWIDLEESGNGRPIQSFSEGGGGDDASFLFFTMIPFHRKNSHFIKQVSFEFKSHVRRWSIIIQPKPWFSHNNANTVMLQELCRWTGTNLFIITLSSSPSNANFTDILSAKVFHKKAIFPFLFKIHWHWKQSWVKYYLNTLSSNYFWCTWYLPLSSNYFWCTWYLP